MQSKDLYYQKYLKYKNKYLNLQSQIGGVRPGDMSDETTEANYIRFVVTKDSSKKNEFLEELKTYALKDKVSNDLLSILITFMLFYTLYIKRIYEEEYQIIKKLKEKDIVEDTNIVC